MAVTTEAQAGHPNIPAVKWHGITWVNIERPTSREIGYLRDSHSFHPLALEDCVSRVQLPKIDEYDDYVLLLFHFPVFNKKTRVSQPSQVTMFVGADYVVTVHAGDLKPLVRLFQECREEHRIREHVMGRGTGYLVYRILDRLVDYCFPIVNKVLSNVERVEDQVLKADTQETVRELSILRRDIIALHRIIRPQVAVLQYLAHKRFEFMNEDLSAYFDDVVDHIQRIWAELQDTKEVTVGLNETYMTLNVQRTNEVVRVLTIVFTVMLPFMVFSGLYGMNVPLPFQGEPWLFWAHFVVGGAIAAVMLLLFRRRGWL
ncbi:MAG: magnesium transporter CorA family protein [Chloroflexota bacterium]